MNREYNTGTSNSALFFVGEEVECTPMRWKKTLFVNGLHSPNKIMNYALENECDHIYFGANQSFNGSNLLTWDATIKACLAEGFWCTLDFDVQYLNDIHETGLCEYNKFVPQISVKIPYIKLLNYNATLKIDDTNFDATNPGVWCHRVHDLMDATKFTGWDEYGNDVIIESESIQNTAVINTKHSISISSYNKDGEWIYQGSVAEYPGLFVEGTDINFVYDELHKEIEILKSRK
jgi:hypothetical protein